MIDVYGHLWEAKWAELSPKAMKRSQRWNTLQLCSHRDSNSAGSLWSNALPTRPRIEFLFVVYLWQIGSHPFIWASRLKIANKSSNLSSLESKCVLVILKGSHKTVRSPNTSGQNGMTDFRTVSWFHDRAGKKCGQFLLIYNRRSLCNRLKSFIQSVSTGRAAT